MELQHLNVKLFLEDSIPVDWEGIVPVFHSWIQEQGEDGLLIDVADYRHVFGGPGVVLVGLEEDYSLDNAGNRPGVRYNRKAILLGTNQDRLKQALRAALLAVLRLESDARLKGIVRFNRQEFEISANDRLLVPHTLESYVQLEPEVSAFLRGLTDGRPVTTERGRDLRSLLTLKVTSSVPLDPNELLTRLQP